VRMVPHHHLQRRQGEGVQSAGPSAWCFDLGPLSAEPAAEPATLRFSSPTAMAGLVGPSPVLLCPWAGGRGFRCAGWSPLINQLDGQKMGPTTTSEAPRQWDSFKPEPSFSSEGFNRFGQADEIRKASWVGRRTRAQRRLRTRFSVGDVQPVVSPSA